MWATQKERVKVKENAIVLRKSSAKREVSASSSSSSRNAVVVVFGPELTEGMWRCSVEFANCLDSVIALGVVDALCPFSSEFRLGMDNMSLGYSGKRGDLLHDSTSTSGNSRFISAKNRKLSEGDSLNEDSEGDVNVVADVVSIDVILTSYSQTIAFSVNGCSQQCIVTGIPPKLRFAVQFGSFGSRVNVVELQKVSLKTSFSDEKKAIQWSR